MVFFGIVGLFAVWIMVVFFRDVVRGRTMGVSRDGTPRRLVAPRRFALGAGLLGGFIVVLVAMFTPLFGGHNLLAAADELFNERAKSSADYLASAQEKATAWTGTDVDLGVSPGELPEPQAMMDVVAKHAETSLTPDGRVRVTGNLGQLAQAAIADAEALFVNDTARLEQKYEGRDAPTSVYAWWLVFDGLSRRYVQENRADEAAFTKLVATKVLEPADNFRGIAVTSTGQSTARLAPLSCSTSATPCSTASGSCTCSRGSGSARRTGAASWSAEFGEAPGGVGGASARAQRRRATARRRRRKRRESGADAGNRTPDPIITSDVLCQLSYVGPSEA